MLLSELQRRVDTRVRGELAPLIEAYRATGASDEVDGFLAHLGEKANPALLKLIFGMADVELPAATDAAFAGTALARWAATKAAPTLGHGEAPSATGAVKAVAGDVRFTPVVKLGEGAMGEVHVARDVYLRRRVALKSVLPEMTGQELISRFLAEMQITAQLEHPNIVPVYALQVGDDGALGYAMKLVHGRDLDQLLEDTRVWVKAGRPLDEEHKLERRLECFLKVCDALEYAHSKGIVHRDLKPSNIMIGGHNEVYLMDWGIARPIGAGRQAMESGIDLEPAQAQPQGRADGGRTRIGAVVGTPSYMSPEQAWGKNSELDGRSDQYAMGLILQECVTLKRAVDGPTLQAVLMKAQLGRRDPLDETDRRTPFPREIKAIVEKATQVDPAMRYPSMRDLADDLRRYLRGEAVLALPEGPIRRGTRWLVRHRTATAMIILGLGLVGAAGTIGALIRGQARVDAAHQRELRVSQLQAESAIQAQLVDRTLSRYESALTEFVGAAQVILSGGGRDGQPGDAVPYFDDQFASKETAPPDLAPSRRYKRDVSILAPVIVAAPGAPRDAGPLRSLGPLAAAFRALMIDSAEGPVHLMSIADQRAAIADAGVPAYRASLALAEGVTLSFPGMGGEAERLRASGLGQGDAREATYFKAVFGKRGVVWGKPTTVDGESVLPASAALYDDKGAFRGVALLEVSLDRLLAPPSSGDLDYVQSRRIVTREGKLMAEDSRGGGKAPLPPQVLAEIAAGKSGTLVADVEGKPWQFSYYPLATMDGYYVAAGQVSQMLTSTNSNKATTDPRKVAEAPVSSPAPFRTASTPAPQPQVAAPAPVDAGPPPPDPPDASAGAEDPGAVDAGARVRGKGPMPKPRASVDDVSNPFEKWKAYQKKAPK